jgi:zinc protease
LGGTGSLDLSSTLCKLYDQVTEEDIMNVASKYFTPDKLTIATISSKEEGGIK